MPHSRTTRLAVRLLLVSAVVLGTAPPAAAAPGPPTALPAYAPTDEFRWSVQPSSPKGPNGRNEFAYELNPQEKITDWVGVSNLTREPLTVNLYATDAFTASDGGFALLTADQPPTGVGGWVTLPKKSYTVPAGKRADIPFELAVPANATPGDHIGGLIASVNTEERQGDGQTLNVERRVAARIYLRVTGPLTPAALITAVDVDYANPPLSFGGDMTVTYRIANDGNVRFSGKARVQVTGPFGVRVANSELIDIPELLPDSELRLTQRLPGVFPAGPLTTTVTVNPQDASGALPSMSRDVTVWALPWPLVATLLVAVSGLLVWWLRRRRWHRLVAAGDLDGPPATVRPVVS
ncbi:WxL protein peptidoglycan domain-containing protein [Polymorphospora rubra]|uniref:WxL protein peptidoglycan domain-containing protein n=1 Tax=Polymorphospora rubra TaxID=338584 RepID=UPI0033CCB861